jgi:hypothetical protein
MGGIFPASGTIYTLNSLSLNTEYTTELPKYLTIDNENIFTSNVLVKENAKNNST